jgi:hypothetical protein
MSIQISLIRSVLEEMLKEEDLYYYDLFIDQHEFPLNYEHYPEWHVKQH